MRVAPRRSPPFQNLKLRRQRTGTSAPESDDIGVMAIADGLRGKMKKNIGAVAAAFITFARILQI
jgi:hypothetical protein